ncbi:hypothetical protein SDC9_148049 [bioreactor metagenome]|uniref:Uncharacterized protein n=1 Tax=bioreactor metagenome TaxID=1076179 RepID=A0A645EG10_9ZZZZ
MIHHRLINAGGDILRPGALIDERLHVAFGKHTAAGRDGVRLFRPSGGGVQLVGGHFQKGRHLVNERPGTAGAGAVHANLQTVGQEEDFGILTAKLDHHVGARSDPIHRHAGGKYFLNKRDGHPLRHAHAGGAGDRKQCPSTRNILLRRTAQQLF